jgi:hypothetical protein
MPQLDENHEAFRLPLACEGEIILFNDRYDLLKGDENRICVLPYCHESLRISGSLFVASLHFLRIGLFLQ